MSEFQNCRAATSNFRSLRSSSRGNDQRADPLGTRTRNADKRTTENPFIDCIKFDTGLDDTKYITTAMEDRRLWGSTIKIARSGDRPK